MRKIIRWALPIIATLSILWGCSPAPTLDVVKFVPVVLDLSQVQMPSDATTAIEAEGSAVYLEGGKIRVVFWKEDNTVSATGYEPAKFACSIGVVYVQFANWHVYYDCQSGQIVASHVAYPVGVMSFANWPPSNADWKPVGESTDANGWRLSVSEDKTLHATSPLGKKLTITAKKVIADDGTLSVEYDYPAAAWLLNIGGPNTDSIVVLVKPSSTGWQYGTYP